MASLEDIGYDNEERTVIIKDTMGDSGPLGLLGFGLTTVLLNIHNAGFYSLNSMIMAMGICYGGFAQLVAGIFAIKKGNTFSGIAFISYATFWWSLVAIWLLPKVSTTAAPDHIAMGFFLLMWCIFTIGMFVGTLKSHLSLRLVFGTLIVLFLLLAIGDFAENEIITKIAGWEGIVCGAIAIYTGLAEIINIQLGAHVLPL